MVNWHSLSVEETFQELGSRPDGLTESEAVERLKRWGSNQLEARKQVSLLRLFAKQFANYFILVLLFAAGLAFAVSYLPGQSERRLTAYFILGIILISVLLSFFEEYRSQRELEALGRLLRFHANVLRDGKRQSIETDQVVRGDVVALAQGQKVPADARLIEAHSLRADESTLTGESAGVDKSIIPVAKDTPLAERTSMVYGSTFITHGSGLALVVSTGSASEVGQIATALGRMAERPTPFQSEVRKMARQITWIIGVLALVVAVILLFVLHESPIDVALNTLSLAVATGSSFFGVYMTRWILKLVPLWES